MPVEDARSMIREIEERIKASNIEVRHRDALIRLRAIIEEDLEADRVIQQRPEPQRPAARR
jgi:hypothetical protein